MTYWPTTTLPYGVVRRGSAPPRPATAVADDALDLAGVAITPRFRTPLERELSGGSVRRTGPEAV